MAALMTNLLATISWPHILIVLAVVLLLFGGKKLPELARGLGRGLRIFKDEVKGVQKELEDTTRVDEKGPHDDALAKTDEKKS